MANTEAPRQKPTDVGAEQRARAEDPQRTSGRAAAAPRTNQKKRQQRSAHGKSSARARRAPAVLRPSRRCRGEHDQPERHGQRSRQVELALWTPARGARANDPQRGEPAEQADRAR
jgi:hypothetical protein